MSVPPYLFLHFLCDLLNLLLTVLRQQVQLFVDKLHPVLPLFLRLHTVNPENAKGKATLHEVNRYCTLLGQFNLAFNSTYITTR